MIRWLGLPLQWPTLAALAWARLCIPRLRAHVIGGCYSSSGPVVRGCLVVLFHMCVWQVCGRGVRSGERGDGTFFTSRHRSAMRYYFL